MANNPNESVKQTPEVVEEKESSNSESDDLSEALEEIVKITEQSQQNIEQSAKILKNLNLFSAQDLEALSAEHEADADAKATASPQKP